MVIGYLNLLKTISKSERALLPSMFSVICKLQEFDRGVFRGAVICLEGEEQWGENAALRSSSADGAGVGCEFSQPH